MLEMSAGPGTYAGDLDVAEVWSRLEKDPGAQLVDVRTRAEWTFVGVPDLRPLGKAAAFVEWQSYPAMGVNPNFLAELDAELAKRGASREGAIFFLCRSGVRSQSAAAAATSAGYQAAYNIAGGFEGPPGPDGHRGSTAGWKAGSLPWVQS